MSFSQKSSSSFTPYRQPKSPPNFFQSSQFDFHQFNRLSLNDHDYDSSANSQSYRSNGSLALKPFDSEGKHQQGNRKQFDLLSMRSVNRKKSVEIGIKPSIPGNMTFLNHSFIGKSQLHQHQDFNFVEPSLHKQLSEKSCPVRNQDLYMEQLSHHHRYDHNDDFMENQRSRPCKKFKKTKNYLRTLSSYLHKYIRYSKKVRNFVYEFYTKETSQEMFDSMEGAEMAHQYFNRFLDWVNALNMTNFQEYQKVWTEDCQFRSIYRQICYKYYVEEAFCDIQRSRLTSKQTIQEYLPQFIQGLLNPKNFTHFRSQ